LRLFMRLGLPRPQATLLQPLSLTTSAASFDVENFPVSSYSRQNAIHASASG